MYQINDAYTTLSNPEKRRAYNKLESQSSATIPETKAASGPRRPTRDVSYDDLFKSIFSDTGIYRDFFNSSNSFGDYFGSPKKESDAFLIPENDWGLLAALKMAYESKSDGKWRIKRSQNDKRDWLPEKIYSVKKVDGEVSVFRRIIDWRNSINRNKEIKAKKEGDSYGYNKTMKNDTFIGEYYLTGERRNELEESYKIPSEFGEYLDALKSLAYKFANHKTNKDGTYDVTKEWKIINSYGEHRAPNTKVEGSTLWQNDNDREWVRKIPYENFWKRLGETEGLIRIVEDKKQTAEGMGLNNTPQQSSGEAKG